MMISALRVGLVALLCLLSQTVYAVPVAVQDGGGRYLGFTGIDVGGTLYDVTFKEGTTFGVFGMPPVFDFNTESAAAIASATGLLAAIQGVPNLDANPNLTFGCPVAFDLACFVWTPFAFVSAGGVDRTELIELRNGNESQAVQNGQSLISVDPTFDTNINFAMNGSGVVWADWSPTATPSIPEPSTWLLLGSGMLLLVFARKKLVA